MKLQGDELRDFIERYADEIAPDGIWKQKYFYIGKYIPEKKLEIAQRSFARLAEGETPLLLYIGTLFESILDGFLLTTHNLHYRAIVTLERKANNTILEDIKKYHSDSDGRDGIGNKSVVWGSESIPLPEIGSASFKPGKLNINRSTVPGTIFYVDSMPFSYFLNQCREDIGVLNDLFGRLDNIG